MARLTEADLAALEGAGEPCCCEGSYDPLVAEVRRLRTILDRVYSSCSAHDEELDAEVLEIRQERRATAHR